MYCWIQLKMEVYNDYSTPWSNTVCRKILVLKLGPNWGNSHGIILCSQYQSLHRLTRINRLNCIQYSATNDDDMQWTVSISNISLSLPWIFMQSSSYFSLFVLNIPLSRTNIVVRDVYFSVCLKLCLSQTPLYITKWNQIVKFWKFECSFLFKI